MGSSIVETTISHILFSRMMEKKKKNSEKKKIWYLLVEGVDWYWIFIIFKEIISFQCPKTFFTLFQVGYESEKQNPVNHNAGSYQA